MCMEKTAVSSSLRCNLLMLAKNRAIGLLELTELPERFEAERVVIGYQTPAKGVLQLWMTSGLADTSL